MNKKNNKVTIDKPKGTRDMMPNEVRLRRKVENTVRDVIERFSFEEIQTPIFEYLKLFQMRSGDKIKDDMYWFEPPSAELKEEETVNKYCLRPELTAATCRFYVSGNLSQLPKPVKAFYLGPCFRYDTPAPGRYREFYQVGVELLGADTAKADAEIVSLATSILDALKIKDYRVQMNDISIFRALLSGYNIEVQNKALGLVDKYGSTISKCRLGVLEDITVDELFKEYEDKIAEILDDNLTNIFVKLIDLKGDASVLKEVRQLMQDYPQAVAAIDSSALNDVMLYMNLNKVENVVIDFSIARGLDYYTGVVFEIDVDSLKGAKQICGGGRYDKLVEEYGGEKTPATGFAFGFDRLVIAHENALIKNNTPFITRKSDVYLVMIKPNKEKEAEVLIRCRNEGLRAEVDLMGRKSMKANMKYANKIAVPFAIIIGPSEIEEGVVVLRDMGILDNAQEGTQTKMTLDEALKTIKSKLQ